MGWQTPFLSTLSGADKDALQAIFRSLQGELEKLEKQIVAVQRSLEEGTR